VPEDTLVLAYAIGQLPPDDEPVGACPEDQVPDSGFEDAVPPHGDAIDCLAWYGITVGLTPDTFGTSAFTTRGELSTFLVRMLDQLDGVVVPDREVGAFPDITDQTHAENIERLAAIEPPVVLGFEDGTFRQSRNITRGQIASMVVRADDWVAAGVDGYEPLDTPTEDQFDDIVPPHDEAINRLAAAGIVQGFPDGDYRPQTDVRRGQIATILTGLMDRYAEAGILPLPTDEPGNGDPGNGETVAFTAVAEDGRLEIGDEVFDFTPCPDGVPAEGDECITFEGEADLEEGTHAIPAAGVSFPVLETEVDNPLGEGTLPVFATITAPDGASGVFDADTGEITFLSGLDVEVVVESALGDIECVLDVSVDATTGDSGDASGSPFDGERATVVDGLFDVPVAAGGGLCGVVSDELGLPSASGENLLVFDLLFDLAG
jgi:hypothetical protein